MGIGGIFMPFKIFKVIQQYYPKNFLNFIIFFHTSTSKSILFLNYFYNILNINFSNKLKFFKIHKIKLFFKHTN